MIFAQGHLNMTRIGERAYCDYDNINRLRFQWIWVKFVWLWLLFSDIENGLSLRQLDEALVCCYSDNYNCVSPHNLMGSRAEYTISLTWTAEPVPRIDSL